jgi:NADPH-dependent F420 reductase
MTDAPAAKPAARDPFDLPDVSGLTIGVIGGTGDQGRGLAYRWASAGLRVVVGSRDPQRAQAAAAELGHGVTGAANADCAAAADVVLIAVPWAGHDATLAGLAPQLAGKVVIDCVNPLGFDKQGAFALHVAEGSACQRAAALLPESVVVGAFHNVSAVELSDETKAEVAGDVLVLGDDRSATDLVQALANVVPGMRGLYAGRLRNAGQVEALTANLISMNRRYKAHASLKVTDI